MQLHLRILSVILAIAVQCHAAVLNVSIYYQWMHDDTRYYFNSQLTPAFEVKEIRKNVFADLVPFGFCHFVTPRRGLTKGIECPLGYDQYLGNSIETCYFNLREKNKYHVFFATCMQNVFTYQTQLMQKCSDNIKSKKKFDFYKALNCSGNREGTDLQYKAGRKTDLVRSHMTKLPLVLFNNDFELTAEYAKRAEDNLKEMILAYLDDYKSGVFPKKNKGDDNAHEPPAPAELPEPPTVGGEADDSLGHHDLEETAPTDDDNTHQHPVPVQLPEGLTEGHDTIHHPELEEPSPIGDDNTHQHPVPVQLPEALGGGGQPDEAMEHHALDETPPTDDDSTHQQPVPVEQPMAEIGGGESDESVGRPEEPPAVEDTDMGHVQVPIPDPIPVVPTTTGETSPKDEKENRKKSEKEKKEEEKRQKKEQKEREKREKKEKKEREKQEKKAKKEREKQEKKERKEREKREKQAKKEKEKREKEEKKAKKKKGKEVKVTEDQVSGPEEERVENTETGGGGQEEQPPSPPKKKKSWAFWKYDTQI